MIVRLASFLLLLTLPACLLVFPQDQPAPEEPPEPPPPEEVVCSGTMADCDDDASNGCESDLTSDPWNCGECALMCDPGAPCNASSCGKAPEIVALGQLHPTRIVARGGDLYWIHAVGNDPESGEATGEIQRQRRDLPYPDLFVSGQAGPESIAVDDAHVYWSNREGGSIVRMKRLGLPRIPETVASGLHAPRAIARHGDWLYWASAPDRAAYRCAVDECSPSIVATLPEAVVSVATNDQNVFVAGATSVLRLDSLLSSSVPLVEQRKGIVELVPAPAGVFWIEQGGTATRSSGTVAASDPDFRELTAGQDGPEGIAIDDEFVYWTNMLSGTVMKAPRAGGPAVAIAANQHQPWGIAVDERAVYWTNYESGRVMRQAREQGDTSGTP